MQATISRVLNKIGMSREEFEQIMSKPGIQHANYPTSLYIKNYPCIVKTLKKIIGR